MKASYLTSSIGRKQIMAVAGLALALFVLSHMLGNLLLFVGPQAYNTYSHLLISNPLIYLAEAGLVAFFLFHIINGIILTIRNRRAREVGYEVAVNGEKKPSLASRTMIQQGIVIAIFVVLHLITFKYGPYYSVTYDGTQMRDIYRLVVEVFQSPLYVIWYVLSVGLLAFHLSHGVYSAFQTFGFCNDNVTPKLKCISNIYGWLIGIGFMAQPIFVFFNTI